MSFLDFSDPEEMFGLLVDFVRDEEAVADDDPERLRFLVGLRKGLKELEAGLDEGEGAGVSSRLRDLYESMDGEFADDPVTGHVRDCIEEMERLEGVEH